ncbi:DNA-binding protein [bacterium]|nr:MAG: DNA-binding protein [bacterium]
MEQAFYRVSEVATILAVGRSHAYSLVATGRIPSVRIGGSRVLRVPAVALRKWIEEQEALADPHQRR